MQDPNGNAQGKANDIAARRRPGGAETNSADFAFPALAALWFWNFFPLLVLLDGLVLHKLVYCFLSWYLYGGVWVGSLIFSNKVTPPCF